MRRIVSNVGPVLHLSEGQGLMVLSWIGEVHIPKAVDMEIADHLPFWRTQRPDDVKGVIKTWMGAPNKLAGSSSEDGSPEPPGRR
jgi:hypothetical protein